CQRSSLGGLTMNGGFPRLAAATLGIATLSLAAATGTTKPLPPAATRQIDFLRDIAPLLQKNCLGCHGAERPKSGLRLDTRAGALKGGYAGPCIVPGKSDQSALVKLIAAATEDGSAMPPKGERLSAQEIGLVRAWIDQGASWPEGLTLA